MKETQMRYDKNPEKTPFGDNSVAKKAMKSVGYRDEAKEAE